MTSRINHDQEKLDEGPLEPFMCFFVIQEGLVVFMANMIKGLSVSVIVNVNEMI